MFILDTNKSHEDTKRNARDMILTKQDSGTSENMVKMYF